MCKSSSPPAETGIDGSPRAVRKQEPSIADDAAVTQIAEGVLAGTHPYVHWTHMAHCATTIYLLKTRPDLDLATVLPGYIRRYNDAIGVPNTDHSGYHETLTQFYRRAIADFLATHCRNLGLSASVAALSRSPLAERGFVFDYYSRNRLFTPTARREWVEPDLKPLPFP